MLSSDEIIFDSDLWRQQREQKRVSPSLPPNRDAGFTISPGAADMVMADQADELVLLRERLASLEQDVSVYRSIVQEALAACARLQLVIARQRESLARFMELTRQP